MKCTLFKSSYCTTQGHYRLVYLADESGTSNSFIQVISLAPLQVHCYSEALPTQHGHRVGVPRRSPADNTASEALAHGPYLAAWAGFEPTKIRTKGDESTNEPPRLINLREIKNTRVTFIFYLKIHGRDFKTIVGPLCIDLRCTFVKQVFKASL